jgi:hypothetical protein
MERIEKLKPMPIKIYRPDEDAGSNEIACLCEADWELPRQIEVLGKWLANSASKVVNGPFVADIAFKARKDASGGGAVIGPQMMRMMADLNMELFLSEYS